MSGHGMSTGPLPHETEKSCTRLILVMALDEVRRRPWIRNEMVREHDGGVCASGALSVTAREPWGCLHGKPIPIACMLAAYEKLFDAARAITGDEINVVEYNDGYAETKDDIITLYEKAIAACG